MTLESQCIQALENLDITELQEFVTRDPSLAYRALNRFGETALHHIVRFTHLDSDAEQISRLNIMDYLLEKGAEIDARTSNGNLPLHYAAQCKSTAIVAKLYTLNPKTLYMTNNDLHTPMVIATMNSSTSIMEYLLSQNTPITDYDHYIIDNPLGDDEASEHQPLSILAPLLQLCRTVPKRLKTLKFLHSHGIDLTQQITIYANHKYIKISPLDAITLYNYEQYDEAVTIAKFLIETCGAQTSTVIASKLNEDNPLYDYYKEQNIKQAIALACSTSDPASEYDGDSDEWSLADGTFEERLKSTGTLHTLRPDPIAHIIWNESEDGFVTQTTGEHDETTKISE